MLYQEAIFPDLIRAEKAAAKPAADSQEEKKPEPKKRTTAPRKSKNAK